MTTFFMVKYYMYEYLWINYGQYNKHCYQIPVIHFRSVKYAYWQRCTVNSWCELHIVKGIKKRLFPAATSFLDILFRIICFFPRALKCTDTPRPLLSCTSFVTGIFSASRDIQANSHILLNNDDQPPRFWDSPLVYCLSSRFYILFKPFG